MSLNQNRVKYSLEQKLSILNDYDHGKTTKSIANKYQIPLSTVIYFIRNRKKYEALNDQNNNGVDDDDNDDTTLTKVTDKVDQSLNNNNDNNNLKQLKRKRSSNQINDNQNDDHSSGCKSLKLIETQNDHHNDKCKSSTSSSLDMDIIIEINEIFDHLRKLRQIASKRSKPLQVNILRFVDKILSAAKDFVDDNDHDDDDDDRTMDDDRN